MGHGDLEHSSRPVTKIYFKCILICQKIQNKNFWDTSGHSILAQKKTARKDIFL